MSTSLNILCVICSEFFKKNDIVLSTIRCGHVFHHQCLKRWLSRSKTCPQCRGNCHSQIVHRLYLNFMQPILMDESIDVKSFEWFPLDNAMSAEEIAKFGFKLDNDDEGNPIYAARVYWNDDLLPAYYVPKKKGVYCVWGSKSHFLDKEIELLHIDNDSAVYKWLAAENGDIPGKALTTGYCDTGEILYTARAVHEGRLRYGKLHPSHGCCYVPYKDAEEGNRCYEVLVRIPKTEESSE